jgi:hypothetical protein
MGFILLVIFMYFVFWLAEKLGPKKKTPPPQHREEDLFLTMLMMDELSEHDDCDNDGWDE